MSIKEKISSCYYNIIEVKIFYSLLCSMQPPFFNKTYLWGESIKTPTRARSGNPSQLTIIFIWINKTKCIYEKLNRATHHYNTFTHQTTLFLGFSSQFVMSSIKVIMDSTWSHSFGPFYFDHSTLLNYSSHIWRLIR